MYVFLLQKTSSSSPTNKFLLTSQGYRQYPQQISTPIANHHNPDAGKRCMGSGSMEVGGIGVMGGGISSLQGTPSFCYGCSSWGYSYPVSAH